MHPTRVAAIGDVLIDRLTIPYLARCPADVELDLPILQLVNDRSPAAEVANIIVGRRPVGQFEQRRRAAGENRGADEGFGFGRVEKAARSRS